MMAIFDSVWSVAVIILAFSILIFVHELGHFLAALLVGVRPERFFIGFDIFGLGLKKEFRGCVYGIGLLPLGGYVKLAGQSDDPREQKQNSTGSSDEYSSKPLWAQATIIVAGVVMNMIFGYLLLVFAYSEGLPQVPPVVGEVVQNTPAYLAGLKPGDRILSVNNQPIDSLGMLREVVVINPNAEFTLKIERSGKDFERRLKGYQGGAGLNDVGINPSTTPEIGAVVSSAIAGNDYSKIFKTGDKILSLNGQAIPQGPGGGDIVRDILAANPCQTLKGVISRDGKSLDLQVPVLGYGTYDIGYSVGVTIDSVNSGSAADLAGLKSGDVVTGVIIEGVRQPLLSTANLSQKIHSQTYKPVAVKYSRKGAEKTVLISPQYMGADVRVPDGEETLLGVIAVKDDNNTVIKEVFPDGPSAGILEVGDIITAVNGKGVTSLGADVAAESCGTLSLIIAGRQEPLTIKPLLNLNNGVALIGIAMASFPEIVEVRANTIAATVFKPGDRIAQIILADNGKQTVISWLGKGDIAKEPFVFNTPENIRSQIMRDQGKSLDIEGTAELAFVRAKGYKKAIGIIPAAGLAFKKTIEMSATVYTLLHRLVTRQIGVKHMSGPLGIINLMHDTVSGDEAFMGMVFILALISINLAIFNLLPFPVLDGGHLLFIVVEWIKGSPPGEKFRTISQYFGVVCLLGLMFFASCNDVIRFVKKYSQKSLMEKTVEKPLEDSK